MFRYFILASAIIVVATCLLYFLTARRYPYAADEETVAAGKRLFKDYCASCHGLRSDGKGPPLGGITRLLSEQTLMALIRNPQNERNTSDRTLALRSHYNERMPGFDWMDDTAIQSLLAYIHQETERYDLQPPAAPGVPQEDNPSSKAEP